MRVRHRIPSIFNLSMVDVLCCALGCVILLWLINLREAKHHEDSAEEQNRQITAQLDRIRTERDEIIGMMMQLESRIDALKQDKSDLQNRLSAKQAESSDLARRLKLSMDRIAALEDKLHQSEKSNEKAVARGEALERKRKETVERVAMLERDLRASEKRGERETARGRELAEELSAARGRLQNVQAAAKLVPGLRADLKEAKQQYAAEKALAGALEKEIGQRLRELKESDKRQASLEEKHRALQRDLENRDQEMAVAQRSLTALRGEKKQLENEAARVRAAADNRFAGITLTGRRVLFLVDMSGSMELVDENTPAPTKWADVRNTVARLMRSLPDVEKYQVIVFAETAAFLFKEQDWLDYDAKSSPQRVLDGLAALKPKGGTNLYAALQAAFRLRTRGLDTIYVLSDGLPNLGEGVDPAAINSMKEVDRNDRLARYLRKTLQNDWNRSLPGKPRVRINTVGFFYESPDVGAFLWALARENDGSFVGMSKP